MYSVKHIKRQLEKNMENVCSLVKFGDVKMSCFRDFCNHLVSDAWYCFDNDDDTSSEKGKRSSYTYTSPDQRDGVQ